MCGLGRKAGEEAAGAVTTHLELVKCMLCHSFVHQIWRSDVSQAEC